MICQEHGMLGCAICEMAAAGITVVVVEIETTLHNPEQKPVDIADVVDDIPVFPSA